MIFSPKLIYGCIVVINYVQISSVMGQTNFGNSHLAINETEVIEYLTKLEPKYSGACNQQMIARWAYITNVTRETEQEAIEAQNIFSKYQASVQMEILERFNVSEWDDLNDPALKRELKYLAIQGPAGMPETDVEKMNALLSKMETAFAEATVCEYQNPSKCDLLLDPDIEEKLKSKTDYDELAYYWTAWHDAMSIAVRPAEYSQFIQYQNQMADANGYKDMSDLWSQNYDDGTAEWTAAKFKKEMHSIWEDLRPYYQKLHAYVRMQLRNNTQYASKIKRYGNIPAHLMGNMWSQQWAHLENTTKPFPNAPSLDATEAMKKEGYDVTKMFKVSEDFFRDMGLLPMTEEFWDKTMFERPSDRQVVCHASAEDMCLGKNNEDFRVKMCTIVDMDNLITVHHEMGHIEYFMQYKGLNYIFRNGANSGFHEAIGDALALAVTTPKHLQCYLGLNLSLDISCDPTETTTIDSILEPEESSLPKASSRRAEDETDVNFLYRMALDKFAFFPFAISMDSWRWEVMEGKINESQYNTRWWEIRRDNQGIDPPGTRDANSFDPAAKYHIVANVEYIRYFVSYILQFQFYEAMCIEAGQYDPENPTLPLHQCDFSGSKEAGKLLGDMMKLGFSKPWPEALNILTKGKGLSADSLLAYFKPLFSVLDERLELENESPCFGKECESLAKSYVEQTYEIKSSKFCNNASLTRWAYQTDLTNEEAEAASLAARLAYDEFKNKEWKETISQFNYEAFGDSDLTKRQFKFLNAVGVAALPHDKLEQYNQVLSKMSKIYGTAKVCPYVKQVCDIATEGLPLEPDLENILATSNNYKELAYYWKTWRDNSGKLMRSDYNQYVDLSNEAAIANGYNNMGDFWLLRYESEFFKDEMRSLWEDVKEVYEELHAYVRYRLSAIYPDIANKPLPAHVLGNMWSQTWGNIYQQVLPYPDAPIFDVTERLKKAFPDVETAASQMFAVANGFFRSLSLQDMRMAYGPKAMIKKPVGREVQCHASAWDFCDGADFRVKMCTNIDMEDFITVHHELGHIQYYLNYKDLNITLRTGANPGFHEAIGDVVALSVATPVHMKILGLLDEGEASPESTINYLMKMALDKIAFLPFGFLIDSYRWQIFDGQIPRQNFTYNWLKMTMELQGIHPPFKRSDLELDFDPGAKYHVPADSSYIQYFVSYILQFQIHKALCKEAGLYDPPSKPLHECDIYQNQAAGRKFESILRAGASQRWQDLLQDITGESKLDASAILEYFEPLREFFRVQKEELKYESGWDANSFEDYFGEGPLPEPTGPTTGPTTRPTARPTYSGPTTAGTESTLEYVATTRVTRSSERTDQSTLKLSTSEKPEEDSSNMAAIIVGAVLGVAVVVILVGYFVFTKIRTRK